MVPGITRAEIKAKKAANGSCRMGHTETVNALFPYINDIAQLERALEITGDNEEIREDIQDRIGDLKRTKPEAAGAESNSSPLFISCLNIDSLKLNVVSVELKLANINLQTEFFVSPDLSLPSYQPPFASLH